jgi:protein involved in polysaccharide export with SLBB domain
MKALIAFSLLALAPLHAAEKKQEAEAKVIVGGQVRAPGPVKFEKKLTLYAAIQAARGVTEFGAPNRVKILRDGKATTHDMTDDKQKQTLLKENDVVEVPQKNIIGR